MQDLLWYKHVRPSTAKRQRTWRSSRATMASVRAAGGDDLAAVRRSDGEAQRRLVVAAAGRGGGDWRDPGDWL